MSLIRVVSLDIGCTLFWERGCEEGWGHVYKRVAKALTEVLIDHGYGVDIDSVYKALINVTQEFHSRNPEKELWHLYRVYLILAELGITPKPMLVQEMYNAYIDAVVSGLVFEERYRGLLDELKRRGFTIVLSTDTGSHEIPLRLSRKYGLLKYISFILSSQLIGYTKASRYFYEQLVRLANVSPSEILHVGDDMRRDYEVPRSVGINTVLYRKMGCGDSQGVCIEDLWRILDILEREDRK